MNHQNEDLNEINSKKRKQPTDKKATEMDKTPEVPEQTEKPVVREEVNSEEPSLHAEVEREREEQLSSLDMLWKLAFKELDEWAKRADFRDEVLLKQAQLFVDSIQRNQENIKSVTEKFSQEFSEWEKTARDEFLMSTTSLSHFFPLKSYEEINQQIEKIQKTALSMLQKPCQTMTNNQALEKYFDMIEQYIALRKKYRKQYLNTIKQAGNLVYENQKGFVDLFAKQVKTFMFPLNKYLEKAEELTKS
ncbi:hypothetical protein [Neobacillus sp. LXY-1]|uniref:hypothetical protein n=1 Tax=Neobacillus sp. LXY-1 TaxID=3379133 RepID=UPI003EE2C47F